MSEVLTAKIDAIEVTIACQPSDADYVSELIWTVQGVQAVEEVYRNTESDQISPEDLIALKVFLMPDVSVEAIAGILAGFPGCEVTHTKTIAREDWSEHWKQHWHPTPITPNLVICPSWESYSGSEMIIRLDPGNAFGTGTHPTTCLMLQALEKLGDLSQTSVLDVGTGSGILAIYAAKLGSREVVGVDNDSDAVLTAAENAKMNQVDWITFSDSPLEERCLTKYDLVLANIIAPVILLLLPEMLSRLADDGVMLFSGLIESSVDSVIASLKDAGFTNIEKFQQGDWFALKAAR